VYQLALTELSRFLRRAAPRSEKPGGHHGPRYPRIVSTATELQEVSVTTVTVETTIRTTIESDCESADSTLTQPGLRD
jgi:putative (di)nucleoside polyphosphate hydrolase